MCQDRSKKNSTLPGNFRDIWWAANHFQAKPQRSPAPLWQCQVHHLVQSSDPRRSIHGWGESPFPGLPSPLFRLQGNHQAFNQSSQRWQPHRPPLRPPGSIHDWICIKVEKPSKPVRLQKEGVITKERVCAADVNCFCFFFLFHLTNTRTITGKVTLQNLRSQFRLSKCKYF